MTRATQTVSLEISIFFAADAVREPQINSGPMTGPGGDFFDDVSGEDFEINGATFTRKQLVEMHGAAFVWALEDIFEAHIDADKWDVEAPYWEDAE